MVCASSTIAKPGRSPFGETSQVPSAPEVAMARRRLGLSGPDPAPREIRFETGGDASTEVFGDADGWAVSGRQD